MFASHTVSSLDSVQFALVSGTPNKSASRAVQLVHSWHVPNHTCTPPPMAPAACDPAVVSYKASGEGGRVQASRKAACDPRRPDRTGQFRSATTGPQQHKIIPSPLYLPQRMVAPNRARSMTCRASANHDTRPWRQRHANRRQLATSTRHCKKAVGSQWRPLL